MKYRIKEFRPETGSRFHPELSINGLDWTMLGIKSGFSSLEEAKQYIKFIEQVQPIIHPYP